MSLALSLSPVEHNFYDYPYSHASDLVDENALGGRLNQDESHQDSTAHSISMDPWKENSISSHPTLPFWHQKNTATRPPLRKTISQDPSSLESARERVTSFRGVQNPHLWQEYTTDVSTIHSPTPSILPPDISDLHAFNIASASRRVDEEHHSELFYKGTEPHLRGGKEVEAPQLSIKKWVHLLRKRNISKECFSGLNAAGTSDIGETRPLSTPKIPIEDPDSTSHSSSHALVTGVKSATLTFSDSSLPPSSPWVHPHWRNSDNVGLERFSFDSNSVGTTSPTDDVAVMRALRRRKILEELVETEEIYVADLKVLVNLHFTLPPAGQNLSPQLHSSLRDTIAKLLELHGDILEKLHKTVPSSEHSPGHSFDNRGVLLKGHIRWRSTDDGHAAHNDSKVKKFLRHSLDIGRPAKENLAGATADPKIAADAARVFDEFMKRFFVYEDYGAKYEMMKSSAMFKHNNLSSKKTYEKGVEVLSTVLGSTDGHKENARKASTFNDLLIKPIQRICKYPLLLNELLKATPVIDGPELHMEIDRVLLRLRETANEINRAAKDDKKRELIQKTWLLQDLLMLDNGVPLISAICDLGHIILCGALHVTYQNQSGVQGKYMLCCLFKSYLVLAVGNKGYASFTAVAMIPLHKVVIEETDNGKGLQCHTAPFAWKMLFEIRNQLFEIILSACSMKEEEQWKKGLMERRVIIELDDSAETSRRMDWISFTALDLKSITSTFDYGVVPSKDTTIHRAATVGQKSHPNQVIIRKTESGDSTAPGSSTGALKIPRSRSLMCTQQVPVLAPRRSERMQLEIALADVWTRETLPFPGMKPERSDNPFKASANTVIRKLSMASITSTLSRRSISSANFVQMSQSEAQTAQNSDLQETEKRADSKPRSLLRRRERNSPSTSYSESQEAGADNAKVNFHETPEKFLPPDFGLNESRLRKPMWRKHIGGKVGGERRKESIDVSKKRSLNKLRRSLSITRPKKVDHAIGNQERVGTSVTIGV